MKPIYKILFIIGITFGVISATFVIGIGQRFIETESTRIKANKDFSNFYKICITDENYSFISGMSINDADKIKNALEGKADVTILSSFQERVKVTKNNESLQVETIMTDENLGKLDLININQGRFFTKEDYSVGSKVCLISNSLFEYIGRPSDMSININDDTYNIVGIFNSNNSIEKSLGFEMQLDNTVFVPVTTVHKYVIEHNDVDYTDNIEFLGAKAINGYTNIDLEEQLNTEQIIPSFEGSSLRVLKGTEYIENELKEGLKILIVIFIISLFILLIAAINIIQIATANIIDNQKQIGLKMALGASPRDIMIEIVRDVGICALKGGYIGVVISGIIHIWINTFYSNYLNSFNIYTALQGLALSFIVGLITSLIPARRAVKLKPIHALRQE